MARGGAFDIEITQDALDHIRTLERKYHRLVLDTLRQQLSVEPGVETRKRKRLHLPAPFDAHWELRFGEQNRLRAFYTLDVKAHTVVVVAVGVKQREKLVIGREEVRTVEGRIGGRTEGKTK